MNFGRRPSAARASSIRSSSSTRMPSESIATWSVSASYELKTGTAPG